MQTRWMPNMRRRVFVLKLLLAVGSLLLGLNVITDGSWMTGMSADLDDDLLAEFFLFASLLTTQGPVVNSPVAFLTLWAGFPFLPSVYYPQPFSLTYTIVLVDYSSVWMLFIFEFSCRRLSWMWW